MTDARKCKKYLDHTLVDIGILKAFPIPLGRATIVCRRGSTTSAGCSADFSGWRKGFWADHLQGCDFGEQTSTWSGSGANVPVWLTTSTSRHWSQTTTIRSASSTSLDVRHTRLSTVGNTAFPVAAARLWNGLPSHVTHCCPHLSIFCCRLKSHLFSLSYHAFWLFFRALVIDFMLWRVRNRQCYYYYYYCTVPAQWIVILDTFKSLHLTFNYSEQRFRENSSGLIFFIRHQSATFRTIHVVSDEIHSKISFIIAISMWSHTGYSILLHSCSIVAYVYCIVLNS